MNNLARTVISVIIAAIVILIVIFTMPQYKIQPKAIFLSADSTPAKPFTGTPVAYYPQNAPFDYKNIGVINLRYHVNNQSEKTENLIFSTLSNLTAKAGGNGFIVDINRTFLTPNSLGSQQVYVATVQVISSNNNQSISQ